MPRLGQILLPSRQRATGRTVVFLTAALTMWIGLPVPVAARQPSLDTIDVEITRTQFGIPHISAQDYRSLGFGVGYAYAEDNVCLLADMIVTVRGERSRYFGANSNSTAQPSVSNLDSDTFYRAYLDPRKVADIYEDISVHSRQLVAGYAAGYNYFLAVTSEHELPASCRAAPWMRPVDAIDILLLIADKMIGASAGNFIAAIASSAPRTPHLPPEGVHPTRVEDPPGSNGYALGRVLTRNGAGLLLANPHYPWDGPDRFYEMHLTIPGELDVMGVALPPFPVIIIGFNKDVAWTHTVSTGRRLTVYELTLNPENQLEYLFEGEMHQIAPKTVEIAMRQENGTVTTTTRSTFQTRFGPMLGGLPPTDGRAYAIRDAALPNSRAIDQWLDLGKATSVSNVRRSLLKWHGTPWVNTIAADRTGNTLYIDASIVPNVTDALLARCEPSADGRRLAEKLGVPVLDGSRSDCDWQEDGNAAQPGIRPASRMPFIERDDFVLNSNDSYWLANRHAPLTGFPAIVGHEGGPQGLRTRMSYRQLEELIETRPDGISASDISDMVMSNRNLAAEAELDAIVQVCRAAGTSSSRFEEACHILATWSRRDDTFSQGAALFREIWRRLSGAEGIWREAFDPSKPVTTPGGLAIERSAVRSKIESAIEETVKQFNELNLPLDVPLGAVQSRSTLRGPIPLHGAPGYTGVLNLISLGRLGRNGYDNSSVGGSSFLQVVTWNDDGPVCHALLTYGQSSNPDSPYFADQTILFLAKTLPRRPFLKSEIAAQTQSHIHIHR